MVQLRLVVWLVLSITQKSCAKSNRAPPCISRSTCPASLKIFTSILGYVHIRYIESDFFFLCIRNSQGQNIPKSTSFGIESIRINSTPIQSSRLLGSN
jgi:hypothetical protein